MSDFKLDLRLQMPTRETEKEMEECEHCYQMHSPKEECEGTQNGSHPPPPYSVPQVEDSSYLKKALARFRKKQAKKKKDSK
jgi:hypothetical protein